MKTDDTPSQTAAPGQRTLAHVGMALACLVAIWTASFAWAQKHDHQAPMEVTSDTPAFCQKLAEQVRHLEQLAVTKPSREVAYLQDEGTRMCDHGQTRGGIMRLRQAILLMKHAGQIASP